VGAGRLASRTHEVIIAALERQIELLGAKHLSNHTKFWETEQRFDTLEIHASGFLLLYHLKNSWLKTLAMTDCHDKGKLA
jgi:hypothetical protein